MTAQIRPRIDSQGVAVVEHKVTRLVNVSASETNLVSLLNLASTQQLPRRSKVRKGYHSRGHERLGRLFNVATLCGYRCNVLYIE